MSIHALSEATKIGSVTLDIAEKIVEAAKEVIEEMPPQAQVFAVGSLIIAGMAIYTIKSLSPAKDI